MKNNKNFKIYRSSAGSGKTYSLALSFIALSLKGSRVGHEDYYRKILAITFTNKAASEMKDRILEYFQSLSEKQNIDGILEWLIKETQLDEEEIYKRSQLIHNHILHHYANLSISTIDKFTYRIVRTFASDLGLSHNFELELDNYKIIQPVVAFLLGKISETGGDLSETLVNFALTKAEEGKSTNIERDLEEFSHQLFKEQANHYLNDKSLNIKQCMQVKQDLLQQKDDCVKKVEDLSDNACRYFANNNLTQEHFRNGTFFNHFSKNVGHQQHRKWMPSLTLQNNIINNIWYAEGKKDDVKDLVEVCKPKLKQFFVELMGLLTEYHSVKSILKNIYSIAVLNELMAEVIKYKKENNLEQISEFNKQINHIVTKQPSSFIYERLGERYTHYLIDEFQDTSLLQWHNLLPLITDSIDYGSTFIVGDGKQSIYRWRGGEVEQFFQLPKIYKGENLPFLKDWEQKLKSHFFADNLEYNYRSRKEIIDFNNAFFDKIKSLLPQNLIGIYNNHKQDTAYAKKGGYLHIELFGSKQENFKDLILAKMATEIEKLRKEDNYLFKDITVLCNSRKRVALVAEYLSSKGISVISNEGLLLYKSAKVNLVVSSLKYLQNKNNVIAKSTIVEYLQKNILSNKNLHELHLKLATDRGFHKILQSANIQFNEYKLLEGSLYETIEQLIRYFRIKEDVYLQFFLDIVLSYAEKKGSSLSAFLQWWEDRKDKEAIVIPEGIDAVQVMTIHKSKGLAFNVVMIPFNWEDSKNSQEIWIDTSKHFNKQLPAALINSSKNLEYSYFKSKYNKEKNLSLLDNLNKLYVAMTRSRERLYIFSKFFPEKPTIDFAKKGKLNSFLYAFSDTYPIIIGYANYQHSSDLNIKSTFKVIPRQKLDWRDIISLKHSAEEIWDIETKNVKKDWGKLLHKVLADIHHKNQKDEIIDQAYKMGQYSQYTLVFPKQ